MRNLFLNLRLTDHSEKKTYRGKGSIYTIVINISVSMKGGLWQKCCGPFLFSYSDFSNAIASCFNLGKWFTTILHNISIDRLSYPCMM